jgi:RND family efflux transporter MFP subunit
LHSGAKSEIMSRRLLIVLLLLLLAGGGGAWFLTGMPPAVAVTTPTRGPVVEAVYATGSVEPTHWVKVGPIIPGRIEIDACVEGAAVEAGQMLIQLENSSARAKLNEIEAMVRFRQAEVERYAALVAKDFASRQAYQRAVSDLDQGKAALIAVQRALDDTIITSPIDGMVLREEGEVGEVVKAGDVLCWVGQERPLRITAEIDEEDMPRVAVGQRALISADAFPEQTFAGRLDEITPLGDPVNKSYRARIGLPEDTPLLTGMTTELNIIVREAESAILVPPEALLGGAVWIVHDGVARRHPVDTGVYGDKFVEVRNGLTGTESIILEPSSQLVDGDRVRLKRR